MRSPRYTILVANRRTGAIRRLTVARRTAMWLGLGAMAVPLLMGLGVGGASQIELESLRQANESLRVENESYRAATGQLADQISTLQAALNQLSDQAELDPATKAAIDKLPAIVKARAMGGGAANATPGNKTASVFAPDSTFGILRDLLGVMEDRLASVRTRIESQQALARATPSIWPVTGWLSSGFGTRKDPFDGTPEIHAGLDISADKGTPVRATADGTIESAGYNGSYGNSIVINHGFGIGTRFGHLSGFAVTVGQKVRRGDVIGYVGATGRATAAHLHYEILLNGQPINPLRLLARP